MTWKKGQSGNPTGANTGKDKLFRQALIMELKSAGEDLPELRKIARQLIDVAKDHLKDNWPFATKELIDRIDGKAPVMVTNDADEFRKAVDMTDDELAAIIDEGRALLGSRSGSGSKKNGTKELH